VAAGATAAVPEPDPAAAPVCFESFGVHAVMASTLAVTVAIKRSMRELLGGGINRRGSVGPSPYPSLSSAAPRCAADCGSPRRVCLRIAA
jgi:hypothetical protein